MKLPRWLVIAMLTTSVLSVLAAAGWWWVTWPERTAREFVALMAAGRGKEADKMQRQPIGTPIHFWSVMEADSWKDSQLVPSSRTPLDFLRGRQEFNVLGPDDQFAVERGVVRGLDGAWIPIK